MRVYGLDFTSAPTGSKPITMAVCQLERDALLVESLKPLRSWQEFVLALAQHGEWIAGIDFPFGQSQMLIENLEWPQNWADYVRHVAQLSKGELSDLIDNYRANRPEGQEREHKRAIDRLAGSLSPMKIYGIPTGKMFHQGAPFLLASPCRIVPFDDNNAATSIVVEAYRGLVVRKFIGNRSYKHDTVDRQTPEQRAARRDAVEAIRCENAGENHIRDQYGFQVQMADDLASQCVEDPTGDVLDSVLCGVQAAWAWLKREQNFGIPADCNLLEGWIPDPETSEQGEVREQ